MSTLSKNLMVGLTSLVGLLLLGFMILQFGDMPARLFSEAQNTIYLRSSRADGISAGSTITYRGVNVGRVTSVNLDTDEQSVRIEAAVNRSIKLPDNVEGVIFSQLIGGSSWISLEVLPPGVPSGELKAGATLVARFEGNNILPAGVSQLAEELRLLSQQLRQSDVIGNLDKTIVSAHDKIDRLGNILDSVQSIVGDEKLRGDIRQSVANFREATESAKAIGEDLQKLSRNANTRLDEVAGNANHVLSTTQGRVDDLGKQMSSRLEQVARLLENLESASRKLNEGKGSAAMLMNDPRLYENLLDTSRELSQITLTVKRIVDQWEQEGVHLKLNK